MSIMNIYMHSCISLKAHQYLNNIFGSLWYMKDPQVKVLYIPWVSMFRTFCSAFFLTFISWFLLWCLKRSITYCQYTEKRLSHFMYIFKIFGFIHSIFFFFYPIYSIFFLQYKNCNLTRYNWSYTFKTQKWFIP